MVSLGPLRSRQEDKMRYAKDLRCLGVKEGKEVGWGWESLRPWSWSDLVEGGREGEGRERELGREILRLLCSSRTWWQGWSHRNRPSCVSPPCRVGKRSWGVNMVVASPVSFSLYIRKAKIPFHWHQSWDPQTKILCQSELFTQYIAYPPKKHIFINYVHSWSPLLFISQLEYPRQTLWFSSRKIGRNHPDWKIE